MIILDTNVVSEAMRPSPDEAVMTWLAAQLPTTVWLSAMTVAEILFGISQLPEGRRRSALRSQFDLLLDRGFPGRVLPFDQQAAEAYANVMSERRAIGRPMSVADGQIAATALSHGARVATRDTRDFDGCGIELINPWTG